MFKKTLFLASVAVLGMVFAPAAHAQTTDTLLLEGYVQGACSIDVQPLAAARQLNLNVTRGPENPVHVANVVENCNSPAGYRVTLASANSGSYYAQFRSGQNGAVMTGNFIYNGITIGNTVITDVNVGVSSAVTKRLDFTYGANTTLPAGTYSDVITLTLTAR